MKVWGEVLERLREERGISIGELCRLVEMERSQYHKIRYKAKDGPSAETINRFLIALHSSWAEWGEVYDLVKAEIEGTKRFPKKKHLLRHPGHHPDTPKRANHPS